MIQGSKKLLNGILKGLELKNNKAKALILGSSGQLGVEFSNNRDFINLFDAVFLSRKNVDITNIDNLELSIKKNKPEYVINCAAYTNVDKAEVDKDAANACNNIAVEYLAKLSNSYSFTLIHFSTDYIFSDITKKPIKENDPKNPVNFYGYTKLMGENAIVKNCLKYFIFRISWVYSVHGNNFPNTIVKLSREKESLNVISDQIGAPTPTYFIVSKIVNLLCRQDIALHYGIYNLTPNGSTSWYEIANLIYASFNNNDQCLLKKIKPIKSSEYITNAKRPSYSVLDGTKYITTFNEDVCNWKHYFNNYLNKIKY